MLSSLSLGRRPPAGVCACACLPKETPPRAHGCPRRLDWAGPAAHQRGPARALRGRGRGAGLRCWVHRQAQPHGRSDASNLPEGPGPTFHDPCRPLRLSDLSNLTGPAALGKAASNIARGQDRPGLLKPHPSPAWQGRCLRCLALILLGGLNRYSYYHCTYDNQDNSHKLAPLKAAVSLSKKDGHDGDVMATHLYRNWCCTASSRTPSGPQVKEKGP